MYCLPEEYVRREPKHWDDVPFKDEWQDNVYCYARKLFDDHQYTSAIDVGCGSGFKLVKYFSNFNTMGLEVPQTLEFLREKYPNLLWSELGQEDARSFPSDLSICSDVIEHTSNPDAFLEGILELSWNILVLSTPERDSKNLGPPKNSHHVQEWSAEELDCLMSSHGIIVKERSRYQDKNGVPGQIVLCVREVE